MNSDAEIEGSRTTENNIVSSAKNLILDWILANSF